MIDFSTFIAVILGGFSGGFIGAAGGWAFHKVKDSIKKRMKK
jgi:hypothetical protein